MCAHNNNCVHERFSPPEHERTRHHEEKKVNVNMMVEHGCYCYYYRYHYSVLVRFTLVNITHPFNLHFLPLPSSMVLNRLKQTTDVWVFFWKLYRYYNIYSGSCRGKLLKGSRKSNRMGYYRSVVSVLEIK